MKPAPVCYLEIPAPNIEAAIAFYRAVFQWNIETSHLTDDEYAMFSTGEGQMLGGLDSTKVPRDGGIIMYIKVDDISETLKTIESNGGLIFRQKFEIGGGFGFSAIFKDPNGNHVGLWAQG